MVTKKKKQSKISPCSKSFIRVIGNIFCKTDNSKIDLYTKYDLLNDL